jgi:hypothetical protein
MLDGNRVWLVSGEMHYFRVPAALWEDRLLKAKRAGLNCVSTYVAWNFHEPAEGKWNLSGDADVVEFVRLAAQVGLYVILRPGPYVCAEWDFGGLPAWLTTKPGISYRTNSAAFTHYMDKYFRQVLPRLADQQVTRNGKIVLIQNENEYYMTTMPDRLSYLEFINQLFRRSGFDIPIVNCNWMTDPPVPDSVECFNGWGNEVQQLKRLRLRQPKAPLLVTEFWSGWFDCWGREHQTKDAREVARRALEILGCGAQVSYYMFHGGTNFGFWGSRLAGSDASYQTTSYDYDAPLAEGGGLTRKYRLTRLVNTLASTMGRFFASCTMDGVGVTGHDLGGVSNISGPLGRWAVVTNGGRNDISSARVSLPDGRELTVSLAALGATAVPVGLKLSENCTLDYSNLMPLGLFGEKVLVLHGPPGWDGRVSVNGKELQVRVPDGDCTRLLQEPGLFLLVVNTDLAMRTWHVDESLLLGPSFVGRTAEDVVIPPKTTQYAVLDAEPKLTLKKVRPAPKAKPVAPRLSRWKRLAVCAEPSATGLQWQPIDRPRDVDHLGVHYGYVWYRLELNEPRAVRRHLFLPDCEDRASVFLNGQLAGVWGRGEGATRAPIPANLRRGPNVLVFLLDNLGRFNFGPRLGDMKGLYGSVYDARPLPTKGFKLKPAEDFPRRIVPRQHSHLLGELGGTPVWSADLTIPLTKVTPIHVSFRDVPHHVAVFCNGRTTAFIPKVDRNFADVTLAAELKKGKNCLQLFLWGNVQPNVLDGARFHVLGEQVGQDGKWSFRAWSPQPAPHSRVHGKRLPAWFAAKFPRPVGEEPLFVRIGGARKGQLFLNGHNVGRFWGVGPQTWYYLPSCWLVEKNELLLFEEHGAAPGKSALEFRPGGPFSE